MTTVDDWVKHINSINDEDDDSEDEDYVPPIEKETVELNQEPPVTAEEQQKREECERKRKSNLWNSFLSDVKRPKKVNVSASGKDAALKLPGNVDASEKPQFPEPAKQEVTRVYDFAGEQILLKEMVSERVKCSDKVGKTEPEREMSTNQTVKALPRTSEVSAVKSVKSVGTSSLSSIANSLGKKRKMGTLQKSAIDWESFKTSEGDDLKEELDSHRKGKTSFLDRKDFLERVDWNQFEHERTIRQVERKQQNHVN